MDTRERRIPVIMHGERQKDLSDIAEEFEQKQKEQHQIAFSLRGTYNKTRTIVGFIEKVGTTLLLSVVFSLIFYHRQGIL